MKKYIDFIYKARKPLLVLFVLLNVLAIYGLTQIKIETDFDIFKTQNSEYSRNLKVLEENFPSSDQMIVLTEYSDEEKDIIEDFEDFAASLEGVTLVKGVSDDTGLPITIDELSPIKTVDGKSYAVTTLFPDEGFGFGQLKSMEDYLDDTGLEYYISGDKYMQTKIFDYLIFILAAVLPVAIIILINVFRMQMKSIKATMLSMLPAVIAALWTLGFAGLLSSNVSILTVLAPIFTIIIGSADGLHFISHVQEYLEERSDMRTALKKSMSMVGVPMIITTITSVAGFVALLFMNTKAVFDLAIFASIGIALAGVITWVILPAIISLEKVNVRKKSKARSINIPFKKAAGWPSLVLVALIGIAAIFGIPHVKTEFNQLMLYRNYTEVAKSFDKIMEVNDGTIPLFALVEHGGDPMGEKTVQDAGGFTQELMDSGAVSKVLSLYTVIDSIKEELPASVPLSAAAVSGTAVYEQMVSDEYSKIIIFPADLDNATIEEIIKVSAEYDDIIIAGTQLNMYELNKQMINGQVNSLLIAFGIVLLSLIISMRKLWLSLLAMLPILLTTLFLFAFLGLTGISLNLFTTTIFSITIGVGIDYAIHFTSVYNKYKSSGLSGSEAVDKAYAFSARPITANALGFSLGLTALMLSPLKVHLYVSLLMWVSMILSSVLSLSFLPSLLKGGRLRQRLKKAR